MKLFNIVAILLTLSAAFGYLNHKYIKLPVTIGTMLISMVLSVVVVILGHFEGIGAGIEEQWMGLVRTIDFDETLLVGMLGFLLFAGALEAQMGGPSSGDGRDRALHGAHRGRGIRH
jgi:CPA1 family monovalent cation:H+ antiporter